MLEYKGFEICNFNFLKLKKLTIMKNIEINNLNFDIRNPKKFQKKKKISLLTNFIE